VIRAALESIAYQVRDVLALMAADAGVRLRYVRADRGMVHNRFLMQFVADIARLEVRASSLPELSALGVVLMGVLGLGAHSATELGSLGHGYDAYEPHMAESTAVQCWNSIQWNCGINPCTVMSMMSEKLMPSACEADVTGAVSMYALQLASGTPSALVDWNNNYGDEPDKCVLFHCGNTDLCPRQHRRPRWADPRLRG